MLSQSRLGLLLCTGNFSINIFSRGSYALACSAKYPDPLRLTTRASRLSGERAHEDRRTCRNFIKCPVKRSSNMEIVPFPFSPFSPRRELPR